MLPGPPTQRTPISLDQSHRGPRRPSDYAAEHDWLTNLQLPSYRPTALPEMHRVLRTGGRLLVVEFRPPKSVIGRRLVHGGAGHAMAHHRVDLLDDLIVDAEFEVSGHGDVRPWLYYVQARRTGQ
jgi:hypothetical protein